jgi:hypothetical protein
VYAYGVRRLQGALKVFGVLAIAMPADAHGAAPASAQATSVCPVGTTNVSGTLLGSQNVGGGVNNSDADRLALVKQLTGNNQVVQVQCSFSPAGGLSGTYTQTSPLPPPGLITHIIVKASTLQQVYAVTNPPVSGGSWSTQCIQNSGRQQPGISGVFCYGVPTTPGNGTINVTKKVVGGTDTFDFTLGPTNDLFDLTPPVNGESSQGFSKPPGTYSVTETLLPGWTLGPAICVDGQGQPRGTLAQGTGTISGITLAAGETVNCTFTNTKQTSRKDGTIKIVKIATGGNDAFDFTINPGGLTQQIITTNGQGATAPVVLAAGTYAVGELVPTGWTLTGAGCVNAQQQAQGSFAGTTVSNIDLAAEEDIVCTFTNARDEGREASLTLRKVVVNDDGRTAKVSDFILSFNGPGGSGSGSQGTAGITNASVTAGHYDLDESGPAGYALASLACNGTDPDGTDGVTIQNGEHVTCTFRNDDEKDTRTGEEIKRFVHRRVDNLLTYDPDRARMLRRLQQGQPRPSLKDGPLKLGHVEVTGDGAIDGIDTTPALLGSSQSTSMLGGLMNQFMPLASGSSSVRFGTSLSEIREAAALSEEQNMRAKMEAAGLGYLGRSQSNAYSELRPGFDVWIEGQIARYNDSLGGIDREGDFGILYLGADYVVSPGFLVGALVQLDRTDEDIDDPALSGSIEGMGWMVGPYFGVRLMDNLTFDARAAWGKSSNDFTLDDASVGLRSGEFDTDRWLASAALTGNQYYNLWRFSPQIKLSYGNESYGGFATSLGQTIDGDSAAIGRLTGTLEIARSIHGPGGAIVEPHVAISGIWNFDSDNLYINGTLVETEGARAKVEGGVLIMTPGGLNLRAAAAYDGLGEDDLEAVSGSVWLSIPLN